MTLSESRQWGRAADDDDDETFLPFAHEAKPTGVLNTCYQENKWKNMNYVNDCTAQNYIFRSKHKLNC